MRNIMLSILGVCILFVIYLFICTVYAPTMNEETGEIEE